MDPFDIMVRWTDRQKMTALYWLDDQQNVPSLECKYIMHAVRFFLKNPDKFSIDEPPLKLQFKRRVMGASGTSGAAVHGDNVDPSEMPSREAVKAASTAAKMTSLARLGVPADVG